MTNGSIHNKPELAQYDANGQLRHLVGIGGLTAAQITRILDTADGFNTAPGTAPTKVPLLRGHTICNLFFENSTRTRTTFELAAQRLSADVVNFDVGTSSRTKGEHDLDTLYTLQAMGATLFCVRHPDDGAADYFARHVAPGVSVINAGDGTNAHPTQALLDVYTIRAHHPDFHNLRVALVGDVRHSRVARSTIAALQALGATDIRVVGPNAFLPHDVDQLGVSTTTDFAAGVDGADIIMGLRIQRERIQGSILEDENDYHRHYGLTANNLAHAKPDAHIMHPGPINRAVEIDADIAYGPNSLILEQVRNGIAVRMAIMALIAGGRTPNDTT
ncbi:aspartate carbamoyltransferase catalytic subunit [Salinisphaera sp. USBA-960]|nr:aspartate carbamoyltransferase catalytic subunit [Salifodinibacter halophilus]NNC26468.1 aspartate carbamoyltransferase catalytic subunit [Salifodinibacter halophilus]